MTLRIALIGCGAMGTEVARRVYARHDERHLVGVAIDARPERAAAVGRLLGVPAFASLDEALASGEQVDAVDVRLPHHLHADEVVGALARGLHVLVEKPLATTLADAQRVVDAAAGSDGVVAVAENYPHLVAVRAARRAVESGDLGVVRALRTTRAYTLGGVWVRDGWRRDGGPSAGILLDQGTHHTSLLRQLGGEIVAVSAQSSRRRGGDTDGETVLLTVRFSSGLAGQSLLTWGTPAVDDEAEATVFGSAARIDVRVSYDGYFGHARRYDATSLEGRAISPDENYYDSHRLVIEDWVRAIDADDEPLVTVGDAFGDLEVVLAAAASVERAGEIVEITGTSAGR